MIHALPVGFVVNSLVCEMRASRFLSDGTSIFWLEENIVLIQLMISEMQCIIR